MEIVLKKPLELAPASGDQPAKMLEKLVLDLEGLTGADVEFCIREAIAAAGGVPLISAALDVGFQVQVAARASGVPVETLRRLGATDYLTVTTKVQGFLFGSA